MHLLIGYGDAPGTTGQYLEEALAAQHTTTFVGRGSLARAGYAANLDLAALIATLPAPPDFYLYVDSGNNPYAPQGLPHLPLPTAAYFMDAYPRGIAQRTPYLETLAPLFDTLFVAHRTAIPHYTALRRGAPVHWLPPCCDPAIHGDQHRERIYDVGFVGQVNASYPDRVRLLTALEGKYRLNDYRRPAYREAMARVYSESKIVVNISHTDQIIPMRFFEAPAAGAMLLTAHSAANGQDELLVAGQEYVSFTDIDDALAKVDYYLAHDAERSEIARAGQTAVLTRHTYAHRVATILHTLAGDQQNAHRQDAAVNFHSSSDQHNARRQDITAGSHSSRVQHATIDQDTTAGSPSSSDQHATINQDTTAGSPSSSDQHATINQDITAGSPSSSDQHDTIDQDTTAGSPSSSVQNDSNRQDATAGSPSSSVQNDSNRQDATADIQSSSDRHNTSRQDATADLHGDGAAQFLSDTPRLAPARKWSPAEIANVYARAYSQLRLVDCVLDLPGLSPLQQSNYALQALLRRVKHRG